MGNKQIAVQYEHHDLIYKKNPKTLYICTGPNFYVNAPKVANAELLAVVPLAEEGGGGEGEGEGRLSLSTLCFCFVWTLVKRYIHVSLELKTKAKKKYIYRKKERKKTATVIGRPAILRQGSWCWGLSTCPWPGRALLENKHGALGALPWGLSPRLSLAEFYRTTATHFSRNYPTTQFMRRVV